MSSIIFSLVAGVKCTNRRAVGFLHKNDGEFDAMAKFVGLKSSKASFVRSIMDHWADGNDKPVWWFHGFNDEEFKQCFVFKWDEGRVGQRLYGFKCHPKTKSAKEFLLCVLVFHDSKTDKVNYSLLRRINKILENCEEVAAIFEKYPEYKGVHKWVQ
jgi:hypothetical protein